MPVAINVFASRRRMLKALEIASWEEWDERLRFFLDPQPPEGILEKLKAMPQAWASWRRSFRRPCARGACQEVVETGEQVDLGRLPVLTCWPQDAGPFVTMPLVITTDPASGKTNVGMYRMQVYDRATTGMHWQKHKDGAGQARGYEREGRRMEVAVAIGCDPGDGVLSDRAAAAGPFRVSLRRLPARRGRAAGRRQDRGPPGPRRSGDRARGLRRAGRAAPRRGPSATTPASTRSRTISPSSTSRR